MQYSICSSSLVPDAQCISLVRYSDAVLFQQHIFLYINSLQYHRILSVDMWFIIFLLELLIYVHVVPINCMVAARVMRA